MIPSIGGAREPSDTLLPGKAGGTVAVRRTLASTICRITDPTQVPRPRQLRDASTVMRFRPAHQRMINRRFDDRASCLARHRLKQALERKSPSRLPATWNGGHESVRRNHRIPYWAAHAIMRDARGDRNRGECRRPGTTGRGGRRSQQPAKACVAGAGHSGDGGGLRDGRDYALRRGLKALCVAPARTVHARGCRRPVARQDAAIALDPDRPRGCAHPC